MGVVSCCGCCDLEILQVIREHRGLGRESAVMLKALSNLATSHGSSRAAPVLPAAVWGRGTTAWARVRVGGGPYEPAFDSRVQ